MSDQHGNPNRDACIRRHQVATQDGGAGHSLAGRHPRLQTDAWRRTSPTGRLNRRRIDGTLPWTSSRRFRSLTPKLAGRSSLATTRPRPPGRVSRLVRRRDSEIANRRSGGDCEDQARWGTGPRPTAMMDAIPRVRTTVANPTSFAGIVFPPQRSRRHRRVADAGLDAAFRHGPDSAT